MSEKNINVSLCAPGGNLQEITTSSFFVISQPHERKKNSTEEKINKFSSFTLFLV